MIGSASLLPIVLDTKIVSCCQFTAHFNWRCMSYVAVYRQFSEYLKGLISDVGILIVCWKAKIVILHTKKICYGWVDKSRKKKKKPQRETNAAMAFPTMHFVQTNHFFLLDLKHVDG